MPAPPNLQASRLANVPDLTALLIFLVSLPLRLVRPDHYATNSPRRDVLPTCGYVSRTQNCLLSQSAAV